MNLITLICFGALFALSLAALQAAEPPESTYSINAPTVTKTNPFYTSNRAPLVKNPLIKLPIGSIRPEGWLRHQLALMTTGMIGQLERISPWCDSKDNAWMSAKGVGKNGWEELPYWLKGYGDLGYVLKDKKIIAGAKKWIDGLLSSQEADGYFGPRANKSGRDLWPNMVMLNVLQSFYEATGDKRVLPFMTKYFRWQGSLPEADILPAFWAKMRGGDNLESIYWLYNRTGEKWLLEVANKVHASTARWDEKVASWHGVNICQGFREPAIRYLQTHSAKYLKAAERNYQEVMGLYGQVPGGMFGADENAREGYDDPRQAAETCSMVEFMHSFQMLLTHTGNPLFADRCEDVAFNSFPASMTPDLKALHYLTAPNMPQCDTASKSPGLQNGGNMLGFEAFERYRCCQHNVSHGWPYYAEHLWMATHDAGLAAVLYSASTVTAKVGPGIQVRITEKTEYPFSDQITFLVSPKSKVRFPLYLRVPRWSNVMKVHVNGSQKRVTAAPLSYIVLDRTWRPGDVVTLKFQMGVSVTAWKQNQNAVSVSRGPLAYSLKIGEKWKRYGGTNEFPSYEIFPTTPWNYALILDSRSPSRSFTVVKKKGDPTRQPFTHGGTPIELKAKARRLDEWVMKNGLVETLQPSPVRASTLVEEITLVPMGAARLRISAFPVVGTGHTAKPWTKPEADRHSASNVHDTLNAISDGIVPDRSDNLTVPRFTWWDRKGTSEWVTYKLSGRRDVRSVSLFWFDDTGKGECRVPAEWQILYRDGREWRPVNNAAAFGTTPHRFNTVTFDTVTTNELRLVVRLQPNFSGGILEWKVD